MSGPPLGQPWNVNVGNNPNINRDPPPPPIGADPPQGPPPAGAPQGFVEQQHAPIYGPPVPIGIGGPPFPAFGLGFGIHGAAGMPLPPPPPGAMAGVVPPFAPAVPLWAPGGGLAFGNVPVAGVGVGAMPMMGMGMGIGMMGFGTGGASMHNRPAPMFHDGNMGFPAQPEQVEPTQIAGGIPPGVTLVESPEHSIIIFIRGNVCPWLSPGAQFQVEPMAFGSSTGLNRVIQVLNNNASPDDCENLAITECIELGNGFFEKGQTFKYNDAVSRVLTMKDAGWDNKRNRAGGDSLHIWLHRI
ncbi:hypothetical protein T440DRAFT_465668 [Plenodomus tracheiphilus IPT5]|uniref:Uncharacterized protein n=1 Tax=Plenodomus tracheiphilus IPT5 TaxID=1408161 RepID=A0A6A7BGU4_9PLEO|nr:hypothetical protein T440DRAFT_465668 [Plenodomus tracheiphilus IPT5]